MLEKYPKDVKLVMKHYPLPNHTFARQAATAALAAGRQGKFWEFHEKIYENQNALSDAKMQEIARQLGLDIEQFNKDLKDAAIQNVINRDLANGQQAGIRGTPTIFVSGRMVKNPSQQALEQLVNAELKKQKK